MKQKIHLSLIALLVIASCNQKADKESIEQWKQEILETEKSFAAMAQTDGIPKAFLSYAAEDAVLKRGSKVIIGKSEMSRYFDTQPQNDEASLTWEPDFVDVSASGDLGYTYGQFVYAYADSSGKQQEEKGIFHTVWKRQADGMWRFVWD